MKKNGSYLYAILGVLLVIGIWYGLTLPSQVSAPIDPGALEYQILMGKLPEGTQAGARVMVESAFISPSAFWQNAVREFSRPFAHDNVNNLGILVHLAYSCARVGVGFLLAALVALPLGVVLGSAPSLRAMFAPIIAILRPISPLAWIPLLLYSLKDAPVASILVIAICALWPMLVSTMSAISNTPKSMLMVGQMLQFNRLQMARHILIPAAIPQILAGMRISVGVAWLVIVAAEMLIGNVGLGYVVWNAWNNLSLGNILLAVLLIGMVGLLLDGVFDYLHKKGSYE